MKTQKQSQQGLDKKAGSRESLSSNKSSVYADKPTDILIKEIEARKTYLEKDVDVKKILPKGSVFRLDLEYNKLKAEAKGQLEAFKDELNFLNKEYKKLPKEYMADNFTMHLLSRFLDRAYQIQKDIKLLEEGLNGK